MSTDRVGYGAETNIQFESAYRSAEGGPRVVIANSGLLMGCNVGGKTGRCWMSKAGSAASGASGKQSGALANRQIVHDSSRVGWL